MRYGFFDCTPVLATYLVLYGCLNLGPDYHQPNLGMQTPESFQHTPTEIVTLEVEDRWWETFGDPELDQTVEEALENNWDLKQAAARVLEAGARYVQIRADRFPQANVRGLWDRQRFKGDRAPSSQTIDRYELSVPAIYEIDLWSRFAKASKAAWNDILQEKENRHTLAQTIVAETITLYLQMEAIERQLQIVYLSIEAFRRSLEFVETRYKRGLTSVLDLRQARRVLAETEARVPELRQELGTAQQQLAVLLGRYPLTRPARSQPEDYFQRLEPIPPGLPAGLLLQRPDIRAAEARLKALNERVGVAKAERLPAITLNGSFSWSNDAWRSLIDSDNVIWSLTQGIVQPVFDAGRLKAGQRAAEARYRQGVAEYIRTVLTAFQEVESALLTQKMQLERRTRVLKFLEEARATQRVAQNRYLRGLVDYLDVLNAQQTRFQAEETLVLVDFAIYSNRVALHRALGGGWAKPEPMATKDDGIFFNF